MLQRPIFRTQLIYFFMFMALVHFPYAITHAQDAHATTCHNEFFPTSQQPAVYKQWITQSYQSLKNNYQNALQASSQLSQPFEHLLNELTTLTRDLPMIEPGQMCQHWKTYVNTFNLTLREIDRHAQSKSIWLEEDRVYLLALAYGFTPLQEQEKNFHQSTFTATGQMSGTLTSSVQEETVQGHFYVDPEDNLVKGIVQTSATAPIVPQGVTLYGIEHNYAQKTEYVIAAFRSSKNKNKADSKRAFFIDIDALAKQQKPILTADGKLQLNIGHLLFQDPITYAALVAGNLVVYLYSQKGYEIAGIIGASSAEAIVVQLVAAVRSMIESIPLPAAISGGVIVLKEILAVASSAAAPALFTTFVGPVMIVGGAMISIALGFKDAFAQMGKAYQSLRLQQSLAQEKLQYLLMQGFLSLYTAQQLARMTREDVGDISSQTYTDLRELVSTDYFPELPEDENNGPNIYKILYWIFMGYAAQETYSEFRDLKITIEQQLQDPDSKLHTYKKKILELAPVFTRLFPDESLEDEFVMDLSPQGIYNRLLYWIYEPGVEEVMDFSVYQYTERDVLLRVYQGALLRPEGNISRELAIEYLAHIALSLSPETLNKQDVQEQLTFILEHNRDVLENIYQQYQHNEQFKAMFATTYRMTSEFFFDSFRDLFDNLIRDLINFHLHPNFITSKTLLERNQKAFTYFHGFIFLFKNIPNLWYQTNAQLLQKAHHAFWKNPGRSEQQRLQLIAKHFYNNRTTEFGKPFKTIWNQGKKMSQDARFRGQDWTKMFDQFHSGKQVINQILTQSIVGQLVVEDMFYKHFTTLVSNVAARSRSRQNTWRERDLNHLKEIIIAIGRHFERIDEFFVREKTSIELANPFTQQIIDIYQTIASTKSINYYQMQQINLALKKPYMNTGDHADLRQKLIQLQRWYIQGELETNGYQLDQFLKSRKHMRFEIMQNDLGQKRSIEYQIKTKDLTKDLINRAGAPVNRWEIFVGVLSQYGPISSILNREDALHWNHHLGPIHNSRCHHAHLTNVRGGHNTSIMWWANPDRLDDLGNAIIEILWAGPSSQAPYRSNNGMKNYPCYGK